ncbi:hypothetical protein [Gemmobacter sp. 24YEA27]|uniref:hypothetical protein n=1 Tax=Gemmobacter sp. 24YEA27 TaxID=3040672 RepID=UPI0024B35BD4|nr:hypothetical protein [Gemmobacter sp. 24YEA27]
MVLTAARALLSAAGKLAAIDRFRSAFAIHGCRSGVLGGVVALIGEEDSRGASRLLGYGYAEALFSPLAQDELA